MLSAFRRNPHQREATSMGYRKAKRLGGLRFTGHLVFGRELHREIARLVTAQNATDIRGRRDDRVHLVDSVGKGADGWLDRRGGP